MRERIVNILSVLLAALITAEAAAVPRHERLLLPREVAVLDTAAENARLRASVSGMVDDSPVNECLGYCFEVIVSKSVA